MSTPECYPSDGKAPESAPNAFFNSCPEEILQLLLFSLSDPSAFSQVNRRINSVSRIPWVVAQYFIIRHGKNEALYHALGRGRLLCPSVLNILLTSGAVISRYLVQVAFHHYFYTCSHFIKPSTPWARTVSLANFSNFLLVAAERLGDDIPKAKHEDDGTLFSTFIKEARYENPRVSWETIREIFETYHFMPFCNRDPLMTQLPLALAIEPRLLPYAVANGFHMDAKYRDFVFRKMFERSSATVQLHTEEICSNVRELCRLDASMFITRTVAAEVCIEADSNEAGYKALKQLNRTGDLAFSLTDLVTDIIKLFLKARAITTATTRQILTKLYKDFLLPPPGKAAADLDPLVRRAMFLTVFAAEPYVAVNAMTERLDPLRLGPLTLNDATDILLSAFVERHQPMFDYLRRTGVASDSSPSQTRKVTSADLRALAEEVALRCLTRENKGKTLKRLLEAYPGIKRLVSKTILENYQISIEELKPGYRAKLGRRCAWGVSASSSNSDSEAENDEDDDEDDEEEDDVVNTDEEMEVDDEDHSSIGGDSNFASESEIVRDLGSIGLEPLSVMLRRDEASQRHQGRRRRYFMYTSASVNNSARHPADTRTVSALIKSEFSASSPVTAVFLLHSIVNNNGGVLYSYLAGSDAATRVPLTLKHFKILAQLGTSSAAYTLFERIREGAPFYASEHDYISPIKLEPDADIKPGKTAKVKVETGEKRPRRSVTSINSYIVPDSDDEAIAQVDDLNDEFIDYRLGDAKRKRATKVEKERKPHESHLQQWIKALSELLKEEEAKYKEERKKRLEEGKAAGVVGKIRVAKNDFLRSLNVNLRILRLSDEQERRSSGPNPLFDVADSDGDDTEYRQPPRKKRKTITSA
ncbi:hypothetical protein MIND_00850700 [Mycena indigotica]|uniref:Uncharacterized protein n=1 Tax=Mycena indigotica TaxID=2126181 RepID=A0A8H6VYP0_9AGAR|nr:uncharacterized protein MIND_00850700 [Mycena indigotica]KAF7299024.1 hypothetical protein MIND_00850700 [Mycena indigotica]